VKKILIVVSLIIIVTAAFAQGNLQFNRVVIVETDFAVPNTNFYHSSDLSFTVPVGKVWKIESAHGTYQNDNSTNLSYSSFVHVMIDKKFIHYYNSGSYTYLPMWLPEGTYTLKVVMSSGGSVGHQIYGGFTGIEFNVVAP
jgi:hypothetical protein